MPLPIFTKPAGMGSATFAIESLTELRWWGKASSITGISNGGALSTIPAPSEAPGLSSWSCTGGLTYANAATAGYAAVNAANLDVSSTRLLTSASNATISGGSFSIFLVVLFNSNFPIMGLASAGTQFSRISNSTGTGLRIRGSTNLESEKTLSTGWAAGGTRKVIRWECDGTHAGHTIRVNGVTLSPTNTNTNNPGSGTTSMSAGLFGNTSTSGSTTGNNYLYEWVICTKLSSTNGNSVEQLLASRYGISI